jgi:hypothetical protein
MDCEFPKARCSLPRVVLGQMELRLALAKKMTRECEELPAGAAQISSVTVVIVARDGAPPTPALVEQLSAALEDLTADFNYVIVANDIDATLGLKLKALVAAVPDLTVVMLGEAVHDDVARLVGIDHAIGDFVLFCKPTLGEIENLPPLMRPLSDGYDLILGIGAGGVVAERSRISHLLFHVFRVVFRIVTGNAFEERPTGFRVLSRAAALFVASRADGEVLIRSRSIGPGFPSLIVDIPISPVVKDRGIKFMGGLAKGLRLLITTSTIPLRSISYIGLAAGCLSVLYAMYVVFVYLTKDDVQAGWTTVSLQICGMMFIFSTLFMILGEYVILILSANPPRSRRHLIVRELNSQLSRRMTRLNIVDAEGKYQVGAPSYLLKSTNKNV